MKLLRILFVLVFVMAGCAKDETAIKSAAFNPARMFLAGFADPFGVEQDRLTEQQRAITVFKFCLGLIRLEDDGNSPQGGNSNGEIDFKPGLIDVSSGAETTWGEIVLPTNFTLKRVKIKFKVDQNLCGVNWALNVNNITTTEELEAKWTINPPVTFGKGKVIRVPLQAVVTLFLAQLNGDGLTANELKTIIESIEDTFELLEG